MLDYIGHWTIMAECIKLVIFRLKYIAYNIILDFMLYWIIECIGN